MFSIKIRPIDSIENINIFKGGLSEYEPLILNNKLNITLIIEYFSKNRCAIYPSLLTYSYCHDSDEYAHHFGSYLIVLLGDHKVQR